MFAGEPLSSSTIRIGVALGILGLIYQWLSKRSKHIPPGPHRYPLIGNLLNFPTQGWADIFPNWHKKYGNIVYANLMGMPIFVIGEREVAEELLNSTAAEGRKILTVLSHSSTIIVYSTGRPPNVLVEELMGWSEWNISLMPPGKIFSERRSHLRKATARDVIRSYRSLIEASNRLFLKSALGMAGNPSPLVNQALGELVTRITYADALSGEEASDLMKRNEEAVRLTLEVSTKVYLVNLFPMFKYIPAWVPGAGFQRLAAHVKDLAHAIRNGPWENVLKDVDSGIRRRSLVDNLIQQYGANGATRDSAAFIYTAAQSTTATSILLSIYTLLMHPEAQAKAFEEVDRVIGQDRLPTLEDLDNLPYIEALMKETLRWSPPFPIMMPHFTTEDTIYGSYFIPKGSMVLATIKSMLRDERVWEDPTEFKPERFLQGLKTGQIDPKSLIFGFGRRICPGRDLANHLVSAAVMTLLWAFEIAPIRGEARPDSNNPQFVDALIAAPAPFRCHFRPRSEKVVRLIREATVDE